MTQNSWNRKPMTTDQMFAMVRAGLVLTPEMMTAAKRSGLDGMLFAGAVVTPEMAIALEAAGYRTSSRKGA